MANVVEIIFRGVDQMSRQVVSINSGMNGLLATAGRLIPIMATAFALKEAGEAIDKMRLLENRLRIVTSSFGNLGRIQRELFDISQATRTSIEGVSILYARVALNAEQMGLSQRTMLDLTKAVNEAIQISGGTAQEASAGIIQFSQAIASGVLRGDELRSITEQMPRLAKAIADGMGVSIGELRKLGAEGALTANVVVDALKSQFGKLSDEFETTQSTMAQGWSQFTNAGLLAIQTLDRRWQLSKFVTEGLGAATEFLSAFGKTSAEDQLEKTTAAIERETSKLAAAKAELEDLIKSQAEGATASVRTLPGFEGGTVPIVRSFQSLSREQIEEFRDAGIAVESIELAIDQAEDEYKRLQTLVESLRGSLKKLQEEMGLITPKPPDWVEETMKEIRRQQADEDGSIQKIIADLEKSIAADHADRAKRMAEAAKNFRSGFGMQTFDQGEGPFPEFAEVTNQLQDMTVALGDVQSTAESTMDQMAMFADQAARNIQTVFADFLFDPFENGLKGMAKGFIDVIRRMIAEALAAKLLETLFGSSGLGQFFTAFLGGGVKGNALGGWTSPGVIGRINEREPEFLVTAGRDQVVPLSKMAAVGYGGGGGVIYSPQTNMNFYGAAPNQFEVERALRRRDEENIARWRQMEADGI